MISNKKRTLTQNLPWILLIGGIIGVIASMALSIEVYHRLKDPSYVPICNLNPVLSCTSIADSKQSEVFGFPNYYLGLAAYAAIATVGAVMLAGAKLSKRFWQLFLAGVLFAIAFSHWLIYQSLYEIGSLCIFCMVVWTVTIPIFWYSLIFGYQSKVFNIPKKLIKPAIFLSRHHGDVLLVWFLAIIGLILERFWYYWSTLL